MAGAVRFSTDELACLASRIAEAGESALALEAALFDEMAALALEHGEALSAHRRRAGACWMWRRRWASLPSPRAMCGPGWTMVLASSITRGRHPVVEAALQAANARRLRAQ